MMRPNAKVEKVYLYPKPFDFRKSIDGLAALVELDIKVAVFDPVLFVFLNKPRNRVKILYWERNGFCLWLKRLECFSIGGTDVFGTSNVLEMRMFRPHARIVEARRNRVRFLNLAPLVLHDVRQRAV